MEEEGTPFKTDDTSLATFLSLHINPLKYAWEGKACFWYFPNSSDLANLVRDYSGGSARVDPREYSTMFSKRKRELYQAQQNHRKKKASA